MRRRCLREQNRLRLERGMALMKHSLRMGWSIFFGTWNHIAGEMSSIQMREARLTPRLSLHC
jgi:hypothetical protein